MKYKYKKHRRSLPGTEPGTLIPDPAAQNSEIEVISYGQGANQSDIFQSKITSIDELSSLPSHHKIRWVNVTGLRDASVIQKIGERYNLHPLALEDVVNTHQRPKAEIYDTHLFIITRMPVNPPSDKGNCDGASSMSPRIQDAPWAGHIGRLETEQVAICVGKDFVVTFHEYSGDVFEPVRNRLHKGVGKIRMRGADYLGYALLDASIDSFFPLLEVYGERVEDLEQEVVERPEIGFIAQIHDLKRDLLIARRSVWPQRDMLNSLIRDESEFIGSDTKVFLRDCYDHTIQLIDMIETYREIASSLIDIQLASVSNRMNEVMKMLTIIATIFIPLTFISGVYGMNFDPSASPWNLPELRWRYGYPAALSLMAVIAISLLVWFRRKGWLGGTDSRREK